MPLITSRRGFLGGLLSAIAAPAVVRADLLMPVRSIERFILAPFNFDSFDSFIPAGQAYQWVAKTVLGEPMPDYRTMQENGWRPVPADRYNKAFAIADNEIEYGGCVLMERPQRLVRAALDNQTDAANRLVSDWAEQQRRSGFKVSIRKTGHPDIFKTMDWS
jgi:hypothetical protein